jgi:hypothetical protein
VWSADVIRRALILLLALSAIESVILYVVGPRKYVYWRLDLTETPERLVSVVLDCGTRSFSMTGTVYYGLDGPAQATESSVAYRDFEALYVVHDGPCTVARLERPIREFHGYRRCGICAPRWALLPASVLLGSAPVTAFIRGPIRRYWRRRKGLCVKCGYDLTGNVSGVCPECGTEVKQP